MFLQVWTVISCVLIIYTRGSQSAESTRDSIKTLRVNNGGWFGDWGHSEYCSNGTYAIGYDMKIEPRLGRGRDDTSLNGVRLICADVDGNLSGEKIESTVGPWGSWVGETSCPKRDGSPTFFTSFALQVESYIFFKDDTSANYIKFMCRDYTGGSTHELAKPPGKGFFGDWGSWSESCPPFSAVCGISTRVEGDRLHSDDTALNDVRLHCCSEGRVASEPFGK